MMTSKIESLVPPSPERNGQLHRSSSRESLTAHPLLSPGSSSLNVSSSSASPDSNITRIASPSSISAATAPKYLPYTPRHRVPTGTVSSGTAVSSPVSAVPVTPLQQHGTYPGATNVSATSKLQLQNLKAIAQNHGLDASCLGWAILEEIVLGSDHGGPAWNDIWNALTVGKATILLPLEQANAHESITPEFLKDHILFCNGSARNGASAVTLSGLRGSIDENLTFRSSIPTSSKSFKALASPSTRASALSSLPPLPIPLSPSVSYPHFQLPTFIPSLPVPPPSSLPPKPPLPPRPGTKAPIPQPATRISNPFASFFSRSPTPSLATPTTAPEPPPRIDHIVDIPAFTIDRAIDRRTVAKAVTKSIRSEIKESLSGLPSWVVDRTQSFALPLHPLTKEPKISKGGNGSAVLDTLKSVYVVPEDEIPPEELSSQFQAFYDALEDDLRISGSPSTLLRRDDRHNGEEREREKEEQDAKVRESLERVERALCSVFYDRLFRPSNSDDASHDEALSSRIAALNMLDLNLEHLGIDVGQSGPEVERYVAACGETISQLESQRSPADKAAALVAAHKALVDGLSSLPPLHLKGESTEADKTPLANSFVADDHTNGSADKSSPTIAQSNKTVVTSTDPLFMTTSPSGPEVPTERSSLDETLDASTVTHNGSTSGETPLLSDAPAKPDPPKQTTQVSGDILLPLIIFSVVKSNPPQLVSHLLYTQRFRNRSFGGEESYCLINLIAVVEFLENVDLGALGLKDSEKKIMSAADLTPIPLEHPALTNTDEKSPVAQAAQASLRGRVEQQVDAIAGSANKVISGVVDSSFGVLRALLPSGDAAASAASNADAEAAPWNRTGFGLLRRESGFSIASLAASLPNALPGRERSKSFASSIRGGATGDEGGQEMVESRPASVRSIRFGADSDESEGESGEGGGSEDESEDSEEEHGHASHDARSIRSFESMMSRKRNRRPERKERMSLSDRLASMSRLTRGGNATVHPPEQPIARGSPPSRNHALLPTTIQSDTPLSSRTSSPSAERARIPGPNKRFLECSPDDLKMSEVAALLQEYKRLAESIRSLGLFDETSA